MVAGVGGAIALTAERPVSAVTASSARACSAQTAAFVDRLQAFVDAAGRPGLAPGAPGPAVPPVDLKKESAAYAAGLRDAACPGDAARVRLTEELGRLKGTGPVTGAVARVLKARLLAVGAEQPVVRAVGTQEDLMAVTAEVPPGSTLTLAAGVHRLREQLVLLQPVVLRGAGRDRTTLTSAASGAAVLYLGTGQLALDRLTVEHTGRQAANVLVVPAGGYALTDARVRGATSGAGGAAGVGLLVAVARAAGAAATVLRTEVADNARAGMAVLTADAARVTGSVFRDNGGCGLCLGATSRVIVSTSRFTGNGVGVEVSGSAAPVITGSTFALNRRVGLALRDRAGGRISDVDVTRSGLAGLVFDQQATTRLERSRIHDHARLGVAVTGTARPVLQANRFDRNDLGIQVDGRAGPVLTGNTLAGSGRAAGLLTGSSRASVSRSTCIGVKPGWVVTSAARPVFAKDGCRVVRQGPAVKAQAEATRN